MAQILIKTPLTTDGLQVQLGPDGKVQYREDLADARSRPDFEKKNMKLPNNLKMIIEDYVEGPAAYKEMPKGEVNLDDEEGKAKLSKAIKKLNTDGKK